MTGPIGGATAAPVAPTTTAQPSSTLAGGGSATDNLGKHDFLMLLVAQLRNQDPMKPMEDREFIAQMAQFSSLEALQSLNQQLESLVHAQQFGLAAGYIGKTVEVAMPDGTTLEGIVEEVRMVDAQPVLVVDGEEVDLAHVIAFRP